MCGIIGFITQKNFSLYKDTLPEAASCLSHRGPDDSGIFFDEKAGLGMAHQRLSILDLSEAGHQPMFSEDGKVSIVYNGEIYNFKETRKILEGYGYQFKSDTDTEVVLNAYLHWGIDCLQKFTGMFALAIWDAWNRCMFLARDHLGIKPLYYHLRNGVFLFASELKGLMSFRDFPRDIDSDAIPLFLHYQYIPAPRTIFRNTYKLLPGHVLIFDAKNFHATVRPVKQECKVSLQKDEYETLRHLDSLLTKVVSDHLVSDVPLGALLSGGIDSSLVVALMQKVNASPVRTFSIGFREKGYNEAPWAARVAAHLGTDHTELYVTPHDAINMIPRLPDIYDEPFADPSAIPTFLVSQLTRSQVTVALSGDGGDEQFAGYVRYWSTQAIANTFRHIPKAMKQGIATVLNAIPSPWIEKCYLPFQQILPQRFRVTNFPDKWQKLVRLMNQEQIQELYRMTICLWSKEELENLLLCQGFHLPESPYEKAFEDTKDLPLLSRLMQVDQKTYLPDAMLTKVDRASMAVGLEIRVPLLDRRVLAYSSQIPDTLKYRDGAGKYILKQVLAQYVPKELFERPKMGFGVPIDRWFRNELKIMLLDYLSPERLKREGILNHHLIETMIQAHLSGKCNHQYRLWAVLMWEMWRERWINEKKLHIT